MNTLNDVNGLTIGYGRSRGELDGFAHKCSERRNGIVRHPALELITVSLVYVLAGRLHSGAILGVVGTFIALPFFGELLHEVLNLPRWVMPLSIFHFYGLIGHCSQNCFGTVNDLNAINCKNNKLHFALIICRGIHTSIERGERDACTKNHCFLRLTHGQKPYDPPQ